MTNKDRASEAEDIDTVNDPQKIAHIEAGNALLQFDAAMGELENWLFSNRAKLKPSTILKLHRFALQGLSKYAGVFRPGSIKISGSKHTPISGDKVPEEIEDFCEYINEHWHTRSALHLASYALWRLNWIHPFVDGNGRTSRIICYLVLCAKLGYRINGTKTIPDQISENKEQYYIALEKADAALNSGALDVTALEKLLDGMLAKQLLSVHTDANNISHVRQAIPEHSNKSRGGELVKSVRHPILVHFEKNAGVYGIILAIIAIIVTILVS